MPNGYERVLAGIRAAQRAGLNPVKVNCVLLHGFNDDQIAGFGKFAREEGVVVRFIEFMPLEEDRVWSPEIVITLDEVLRRMAEFMPLRQIEHERSETARRYVFEDGIGEIGIIAPVSQPFCGACSRIRVTSDGKIRTCLFSVREHDLGGLMSRGASDEEMEEFIISAVDQKEAVTISASRDLCRLRGPWLHRWEANRWRDPGLQNLDVASKNHRFLTAKRLELCAASGDAVLVFVTIRAVVASM